MFRRRPLPALACPGCSAVVTPSRSRLWLSKAVFCPECGSDVPLPLKQAYESFEYAPYVRRGIALLIDFHPLVIAAVLFVVGLYLLQTDPAYEGATEAEVAGAAIAFYVLAAIGVLLVQLPLWWRGTSIGKRLLGLRVAGSDASQVRFGRMLLRELLGKQVFFVAVTIFSAGAGALMWSLVPIWDRNHQAPHDTLVETVVVRAPPKQAPLLLVLLAVMLAVECVFAAAVLVAVRDE